MKIYLDCVPCFLRQALDAVRLVSDDESVHEQILYDVLELTKQMDFHQPPPAIGRIIHQKIRELTGNPDPYRQMKQQQNAMALSLYDLLEPTRHTTENPLEYAIRLAIAGNIIDLGIQSLITEEDVQRTINESLMMSVSGPVLQAFESDVAKAEKILFLADNAGEIVFDRLLIEQLPMHKITVAVKGSPIINDATMEDAESTGLTKIVNVIDNGWDGPGTLLGSCSDEFLRHFEQSDLVIAKGQGNYETLSDVDKDIYFLLKAKCSVLAAHLGVPMGTAIFKQHKAVTNVTE